MKTHTPSLLLHTPIFLFLLGLDQLSKAIIIRTIPLYGNLTLIPGWLNITHLYNTGVAFGMFAHSNRFFMGFSLAVFLLLLWQRRYFSPLPLQLGWVFLLSGIIGNLLDRITHGHVIDFIDLNLWGYHWPSFNVADASICLAAGFFILSTFGFSKSSV